MEKQPLICIVGPTASGKTGVSIALAKKLGAEILSADSVQVYRGLDIGSAKPSLMERQGIPHHMIDCVEITDASFSVSAYFARSSRCIKEIQARGCPVIVVGGSGLYVQSLTQPLNFAVPADAAVRAKWEKAYDTDPAAVFAALGERDHATGQRLHRNDKKRIVRAMEVWELSGKPLSAFGNDFHNQRRAKPPYPSLRFGLAMEREKLYQRIDERVERMMEAGLYKEARALFDQNPPLQLPAMQSIGYRQLFEHFMGNCTLPEAVEAIKRDTRRFAKRQMTWFQRDEGLQWVNAAEYGMDAEAIADEIARRLGGEGVN